MVRLRRCFFLLQASSGWGQRGHDRLFIIRSVVGYKSVSAIASFTSLKQTILFTEKWNRFLFNLDIN